MTIWSVVIKKSAGRENLLMLTIKQSMNLCSTYFFFINSNLISFSLTSCRSFDLVVQLPAQAEFILVKCKRISNKKPEVVYTNGHALVRKKPDVTARFKNSDRNGTENKTRPLSVLLIGIDSISRLNLIRAMPNTAQYLYDTGWMELKGYNKVSFISFLL